MERRKFVIGAGALATGSAAAVGSGAFGFARAQRDVDVEVVGDADAYIGLEENSAYADESGNQLHLAFDGTVDEQNGDGLNDDAAYSFENVFKITHNGTEENQRVSIFDGQDLTYDSESLDFYYTSEEDPINTDNVLVTADDSGDNPELSPGDSLYVDILVNTFDDDFPEEIGIVIEG